MAVRSIIRVTADRFGNQIDPTAGYARGPVLRSIGDEVLRMLHGRRLVASHARKHGHDVLANLTGLTREFRLSSADLDGIADQLRFYSTFDGRAESVGLQYAGGDSAAHAACLGTRVSASMLATMLALLSERDLVLSVVPRGLSHPSVQNAVRIAGAEFLEVVGVDAGLEAIEQTRPRLVVVTTITPQQHWFDESDTRQVLKAAAVSGALTVVDDAHAALRIGYFGQAPPLQLGNVDVAICSMDKHLPGPRAALVVGRGEVIEKVRSVIYQLGVEAPFATYVAAMRAMERFSPTEIAEAGKLSEVLREELAEAFPEHPFYSAGPGIALHEDDLLDVALSLTRHDRSQLVPVEVSSLVAMECLQQYGLVTILSVGMPGASAALRIMMYPDGPRVGASRIAQALKNAISVTAECLNDKARARKLLLA